MKKVNRVVMVFAVFAALVCCVVTGCAVAASSENTAQAPKTRAVEDYAAEEMAISDYYEGIMQENTVY